MYARLPQLAELAAAVDRGEEGRPIMLCEYAHSMGNSTGVGAPNFLPPAPSPPTP